MFEKFQKFMGIEKKTINNPEQFLKTYSGCTFQHGLYRIHRLEDINKWTNIVEEVFPKYKGNILVFGYDWLGRQFALNQKTGTILLMEPGTGEVLNIPADFVAFHDEEIADYSEDSLASDFFDDWRTATGYELAHHECAGYKVPLFLNGQDNLSNLEVSDMEVYWSLMGEMIHG